MKKIVVLGGGFGGVAALHTLAQNSREDELELTLIDKNTFHLFTPSLYEVASSEEPKVNVAIPFREIFPKHVRIFKDSIKSIDTKQKKVLVTKGPPHPYDYLVISLGSESADFHIPGLTEHGLPLKTLADAIAVRNNIRDAYHKAQEEGRVMRILIGGGGFSGTELAGELTNYRRRLAKHHRRPRDCVEISVISGSECLLKELDMSVSRLAEKRLRKEQVVLRFGEHIASVTEHSIKTDRGNTYPFDVLIWTGGVRASRLPEESGLLTNQRGQVPVNELLQISGETHVYAVGDIAEFIEPETNAPIPTVAQVAEDQGKQAAENILHSIRNEKLVPYEYRHFGYIVPLKGHYAVAQLPYLHLSGLAGWILQQLVFLRYLYGILPLSKAMKRWNKFEKELL